MHLKAANPGNMNETGKIFKFQNMAPAFISRLNFRHQIIPVRPARVIKGLIPKYKHRHMVLVSGRYSGILPSAPICWKYTAIRHG